MELKSFESSLTLIETPSKHAPVALKTGDTLHCYMERDSDDNSQVNVFKKTGLDSDGKPVFDIIGRVTQDEIRNGFDMMWKDQVLLCRITGDRCYIKLGDMKPKIKCQYLLEEKPRSGDNNVYGPENKQPKNEPEIVDPNKPDPVSPPKDIVDTPLPPKWGLFLVLTAVISIIILCFIGMYFKIIAPENMKTTMQDCFDLLKQAVLYFVTPTMGYFLYKKHPSADKVENISTMKQ
eukprot:gene15123-16679_t